MLNVHQCEGSAVDACDDATSEASRPCPLLSNGRGGSKRTLGEFSTARKVVEACGEGGSCRAHAEEKKSEAFRSVRDQYGICLTVMITAFYENQGKPRGMRRS